VKYYSALKKELYPAFVRTWVNLDITLTERNQAQKANITWSNMCTLQEVEFTAINREYDDSYQRLWVVRLGEMLVKVIKLLLDRRNKFQRSIVHYCNFN
jgi:hypothetical protein